MSKPTLTIKQLKALGPCAEGFKWYSNNIKTDDLESILLQLAEHRWDWCRWLMVMVLNEKQNRLLAIYCAELVLPIFESKYPDDKRPRKAVEATKDFMEGKISAEDLSVARSGASAAAYYAAAAYAADAAYAAYAAYDAAAYAADATYDAAAAAAHTRQNIKPTIVKKVIELLTEGE